MLKKLIKKKEKELEAKNYYLTDDMISTLMEMFQDIDEDIRKIFKNFRDRNIPMDKNGFRYYISNSLQNEVGNEWEKEYKEAMRKAENCLNRNSDINELFYKYRKIKFKKEDEDLKIAQSAYEDINRINRYVKELNNMWNIEIVYDVTKSDDENEIYLNSFKNKNDELFNYCDNLMILINKSSNKYELLQSIKKSQNTEQLYNDIYMKSLKIKR